MNEEPRNFDLFRVARAPKRIDVSQDEFRKWVKSGKPYAPKIYRMNGKNIAWGRYSEVENFIMQESVGENR